MPGAWCAARQIPGVFEPFRYEGHVYCDGGMMNDFPINALPDRQHRLGLCVKQQVYVSYNMGPIEQIVGRQLIEAHPRLREELCDAQSRLWREGAYPTRELIDFATTCGAPTDRSSRSLCAATCLQPAHRRVTRCALPPEPGS